MTTPTRRCFIEAAAVAVSSVVANGATPPLQANAASAYDADALAADVSAKLFAQDELARPIPETPTVSDLAKGLDRTLVLGGGGEYYVAWYCGFFRPLRIGRRPQHRRDGGRTSAGAYAGSSLGLPGISALAVGFDFFGHFRRCSRDSRRSPAPTSARGGHRRSTQRQGRQPSFNPRYRPCRARADNRVNGSAVERLRPADRRQHDWLASAKMYTTANDCYSGERLIVGQTVACKTSFRWPTRLSSSSLPLA